VSELARRFYTFASDVWHALNPQPSIERKQIAVDGNFPVSVLTRVRATDVLRTQTYKSADGASTVSDTSIAWRLSDDPREPGIVIDAMGGLTAGTVYTVRLLIVGDEP
jgi:hypothetical protein